MKIVIASLLAMACMLAIVSAASAAKPASQPVAGVGRDNVCPADSGVVSGHSEIKEPGLGRDFIIWQGLYYGVGGVTLELGYDHVAYRYLERSQLWQKGTWHIDEAGNLDIKLYTIWRGNGLEVYYDNDRTTHYYFFGSRNIWLGADLYMSWS